MGSSGALKCVTDNNSPHVLQARNSSATPSGHQRLVKASTMPSTGSHPSLEDVTCMTLSILQTASNIVLVL